MILLVILVGITVVSIVTSLVICSMTFQTLELFVNKQTVNRRYRSTQVTSPIPIPTPVLPGNPVFDLGPYGIEPWGKGSNFTDPEARWIWATSNANTSADINTTYTFHQMINNTTTSLMPITVHVIVDNGGSFELNGKHISKISGGWTTPEYPKINTTLQPGWNMLTFDSYNSGSIPNPAGLLVAVRLNSDNSILLRTNSAWKFTTVSPSPIHPSSL